MRKILYSKDAKARALHFKEKEEKKKQKQQEFLDYYLSTGHNSQSIINPEYGAIHKWIHTVYGKATKCQNKNCDHKSKIFEWCKKRDVPYDYKIENFVQLCRSCHRKMDSKNKFDQIENFSLELHIIST